MTSRKKRAERGRVWAQQLGMGACSNCGEKGRHFAPPGFGSPGMFICKPKDEETSVSDETDTTSEVARVLGEHRIECTGLEGVTCRGCRELGWMSWLVYYGHQAAALAEAGLLREETGSAETCDSEVWSMDYYRDGQVDPYWIRCNTLGPHVEHEDANTGLTWTTEEPS